MYGKTKRRKNNISVPTTLATSEDKTLAVGFRAELSRFFHREVSHLSVWFSDQGLVKGLAFSPLFCAAAAELALKQQVGPDQKRPAV
ncbi:hypothetical protein [Rhizobium ruizarguesonis]|uniref:hypothetical protein n=1 Tax=Rhizobium ruizarguesonis TaxID=2081791 RepID=UPI0013EF2476|nr:hypothetical protein [Rhizobium ruizarguesonis]